MSLVIARSLIVTGKPCRRPIGSPDINFASAARAASIAWSAARWTNALFFGSSPSIRRSRARMYSTGDICLVRISSASWVAGRKPASSSFIVIPFYLKRTSSRRLSGRVPPSVCRPSAGNVEHRAGGEAGLLAGQPQDQRGDLINRAEAANGDFRQHPVHLLRGHLLEQGRLHRRRGYAVDADLGCREFLTERLGQSDDASL